MHDTGNSNGNMGGLQPSPQAFSLDPLSARSLGESISRRVSLGDVTTHGSRSRKDRAENAWELRLGGIVFQLESFFMEPHLIC